MKIQYVIYISLFILAVSFIPQADSQLCAKMEGGCADRECMNNTCRKCKIDGRSTESDCKCRPGEYTSEDKCMICPENCQTCKMNEDSNELKCTSCAPLDGWALNHISGHCECTQKYLPTGDLEKPCKACFTYGTKCEEHCPEDMIENTEYMMCQKETTENLENDDDVLYIITTICLIILIIVLTALLYHFFYQVFRKILIADANKILPLAEEERFYLANQQEIQRQRKDKEQELVKQIAEEEDERREQEDDRRVQREKEFEKLKQEEDLRRRQVEEDERRLKEEEDMKRKAEEEHIRQMEEEMENRLQEEEQNLRVAAEEAERTLLIQQDQAAYQRIEQKKQEKKQQEEYRKQLLQQARDSRQQKRVSRQLTKQQTIAQNEAQVNAMRAERERLRQEKEAMRQQNKNAFNKAEEFSKEAGAIKSRIEKAQLRRQETALVKQNILIRQSSVSNQRKELEEAMKSINYKGAMEKVRTISQDDIIFLQNLRTPPERIRMCMEAVVMVLNNTTNVSQWDNIKKVITNMNFRRQLLTYTPEMLSDKINKKVLADYVNTPNWNIEKIHKASIAAGAFSEWVEVMAKFKKIKDENKPLFERLAALQRDEIALQGDMEQLEDLDQEDRKIEEEENRLKQQDADYRVKYMKLQKQATMNDQIIKQREEEIEALQTRNYELQAITEGEEALSDIGSDVDIETLNQLLAQDQF